VLEASFENETATLEKDGVRIDLKMGKGPTVGKDGPPVPAAVPGGLRPPVPMPAVHPAVPPPPGASNEFVRPGIVRRAGQGSGPPMPGISPVRLAELQKTKEEMDKLRASGGDLESYRTRLRERRAKENEQKAAAEQAAREEIQTLAKRLTAEEMAKRERDINLKLIEQGARPISDIVLTAEEDKALVEKGVLP
jgi:hypothetical protein